MSGFPTNTQYELSARAQGWTWGKKMGGSCIIRPSDWGPGCGFGGMIYISWKECCENEGIPAPRIMTNPDSPDDAAQSRSGEDAGMSEMHEWEMVDNKSPSTATSRMRVPSGWIYRIVSYRDAQTVFVFVPGHLGTDASIRMNDNDSRIMPNVDSPDSPECPVEKC
jgi:hypothetical protein